MKQQLLISFTCIVLVTSCKKENGGHPPSGMVKYLERIVTIEDGQAVTYRLTYDNENRLIGYNSIEDSYQSKVTYDDNSNPVKFELEAEGAKQVFDIIYNSLGAPIRATSKFINPEMPHEEFVTEITYEVANGKVNKMHTVDEVGNEATYTLSYAGNNLAKVVYTSEDGELVLTWKYGNKKSPYSASRFNYLVIPDLFSVFSSENEITEASLEWVGVGSFTTKQEYQYDAAGYPSSSTEKEDGRAVRTIVFHYKP